MTGKFVMDQDSRRLIRRGGAQPAIGAKGKNIDKNSIFSPVFLTHTENLPDVEAGGRLCFQGAIGSLSEEPSPPKLIDYFWNRYRL